MARTEVVLFFSLIWIYLKSVLIILVFQREIPVTVCSWFFIVEKILEMASQPLRDILRGAQKERDSKIAYNSCHILSKLVAELSAEAMGINVSWFPLFTSTWNIGEF